MLRSLDWLRRFVTFSGGLLFAACGVFVFLQALTLVPPVRGGGAGLQFVLDLGPEPVSWRLTWAAAGVAAAVLGVLVAAAAVARTAGREPWVTLEKRYDKIQGNSVVRVSRRALRGLAARMVELVPGVHDSDPVLELTRKGWRVQCGVYVSDGPGLPELLREIERTLRHGLEAQTGHPVDDIDVRAQITPFNPKRRVQ